MSAGTANPAPADVQAFCRLIEDIEALPDVLRPGFDEDEDDSMRLNHEGAAALVESFMKATPHALARPLGAYLVYSLASFRVDAQWFMEVLEDYPFNLRAGSGAAASAPEPTRSNIMEFVPRSARVIEGQRPA